MTLHHTLSRLMGQNQIKKLHLLRSYDMYKLILNLETKQISCIQRISDGTIIPVAEDNTDYQQYLAWLEEGNEPLPPDPIPEPEPLTPQQKLEAAGLSIEELKELLGL